MADLTATDLENLHKLVLERFKVEAGSKPNLLEAIAARPNSQQFGYTPFPDVYAKAASIMEAIIRWHPFTDGNKRTALVAVSVYLDINGYVLYVPLSAVRYTVLIARNRKTDQESINELIDDITNWIWTYAAQKDDWPKRNNILKKVRREYGILLLLSRSFILRKLAESALNRMLAVDIYPEYKTEIQDIVEFLTGLLEKTVEHHKANNE